MTCPLDTDSWKLGAYLKWRPVDKLITCHNCGGSGEVGGGFKSLDGPRECSICYGLGKERIKPSQNTEPTIPQELVNHMRKAWQTYFNLPPPEERQTEDGVKL